MIKDEFKFIKNNKLILLSVLVMMIIPVLYSGFFLKSVWDPYGDTKDLPVAVVNNDKPVTVDGTEFAVGKQTVDKLKENHQLGWSFVSEEEAKKGMADNKYYTVVTIPEDFSENAATVLSEKPKKMTLKYETNDSLNYIGQVISGIGVDTLNSEIRANVTNAYASTLFDQIKSMGKQMNTADAGAQQLSAGSATLDDGINTYTVGVSTVKDGIQTLSVAVSPLSSKMNEAANGANTLSNGVTAYTNGATTLAGGIQQLNGKTGTLRNGVGQLTTGSSTLRQGITDYTAGVGTLNTGINTLATQVIGTPQTPGLGAGTTQLVAGLTNLKAGITKLKNSQPGAELLMGSRVAGYKAQSAKVKQELINAGINPDDPQYKALNDAVNELDTKFKNVTDTQTAINTQLVQGINELETGATTVLTGMTTLNGKVGALSAGLKQLQSGSQKLAANSAKLNGGSSELATGLNQLNQQVPVLISGVQQLNNGAQTLTGNNQALTSGAGTLATGLNGAASQVPELTSGVDKLLDGTTELNNNSGKLTDGASKLADGSETLAEGLNTGAKKLNDIKLSDQTADMFAAPSTTKHSNYSTVDNYGHALAPYVLSLALYVGSLVFNFAYPIRKVSRKDGNVNGWFASKVVVGGIVATGMAIVEAGIMMMLGLQVQHVGLFFLVAELFALVSMYLIMFLAMWLDNPGRFIAMVLLMLQLGGSGGTFPMEITNSFYNAIHPFLPMSYSIMGFREALTSGIATSTVTTSIIFLVVVILASLALLYVVMHHLARKNQMGISQLDGNQNLMEVEN